MPVTPYPYQEVGIDWLMQTKRARILADDMGLGKTIELIVAASRLGAKRVLVVTLNSTRRVWRQEMHKVFEDPSYVVVDAYEMTVDDRREAIRDRSKQFVIINYELMLKHISILDEVYWDVVIFDEAHRLKNRYSKTNNAARKLQRKSNSKLIWFATGTPIENHQEDYWALLRVCDPRFGSYWRFVEEFCNVETIFPPKFQAIVDQCRAENRPIPDSIKRQAYGTSVSSVEDENDPRVSRLREITRQYILRRTKEQVFPDMPPKTYQRVPIAPPSDFRRMDRELESKMLVTLPTKGVVTVDSDLALMTRRLQLATSWQLLLGEAARNFVYNGPKKEALLESIEEIDDQPFVVFSQWSTVIDMIANLFSDKQISYSEFTGENVATRDRELDRWNEGKTQALLVTIGAGGVGLDFTRASTALFVDRSWNPKRNEQAEDRLHRHGQTRPVLIRDFFVEGSVEDERQFVSIDLKTKIAENLVESLV